MKTVRLLFSVLGLLVKPSYAGLVTDPSQTAHLWPRGVVPFVISSDFPNPERVLTAISILNRETQAKFIARGRQSDYLLIGRTAGETDPSGCTTEGESHWGKGTASDGITHLNLGSQCDVSNVLHELAHVLGLWHEQQRADQSENIRVHYENIFDHLEIYFWPRNQLPTSWGRPKR